MCNESCANQELDGRNTTIHGGRNARQCAGYASPFTTRWSGPPRKSWLIQELLVESISRACAGRFLLSPVTLRGVQISALSLSRYPGVFEIASRPLQGGKR